MNKKADLYLTLIAIVLTVVSFMIVSGLMMRFFADRDEVAAENLCYDSIGLRAATALRLKGGLIESDAKITPALCKTIDKKMSGDEEKIKKQLADKIVRCWWMFHEGKYEEILSEEGVPEIQKFWDSTELMSPAGNCFNCYVVLIDELKGGEISSLQLGEYLKETAHPKIKGETYLQYIQSHGGPGRVILAFDQISSQRAYGIAFAPVNKELSAAAVGKDLLLTVPLWALISGRGSVEFWALFSPAAPFKQIYRSLAAAIDEIVKEREVSSILVMDLETAQKNCGTRDIAGR